MCKSHSWLPVLGTFVLMVCLLGCATTLIPDSKKDGQGSIAYLAFTGSFWQVWIIEPDGTNARQLTKSDGDKTRVTWFPNGAEVLVSTQAGKVYRVSLVSSEETLIDVPLANVRDAAVSSDGTNIAFSATAFEERDAQDLWVIKTDGTGLRRLVRMPALQYGPAWTADDQWVYFFSGPVDRQIDIWRVKADGSAKEQVVYNMGFAFEAAVGSRGELAFSSNKTGDYEIWIVNEDGEFEQITSNAAVDASPAWSGDGKKIVFESGRSGQLNLWKLNLEQRDEPPLQLTTHDQGARAPRWWYPVNGTP